MDIFLIAHLANALKGLVDRVDGLFQKSLKRAIPNLEQLLENPRVALDFREVVISPTSKFFSATLAGIVFTSGEILCSAVIFLVFQRFLGIPSIPDGMRYFVFAAIAVPTMVIVFRRFRGGYCILTQEGVNFMYRNKLVRCSWPVFNSIGESAYLSESDSLLLPISPSSIDMIAEINSELGNSRCIGLKVRLPQWTTDSKRKATLKSLYVVNIKELGDLLTQVGRKFAQVRTS
jgi:hypothetical protein